MRLPQLAHQRKRRFLVPSVAALLSCVATHLETRSNTADEIIETVYFNTDQLSLPFKTSVKATRRPSETGSDAADGFYLFDEPNQDRNARRTVHRPARLSEIPEIVWREQGFADLRPHFAVRYRRARHLLKESRLCLTIDSDVRYYSLLDGRVLIGQEAHPRVKLGKLKEADTGSPRGAFEEALHAVKTLPVISKRWMGYSLMEEFYRFPVRNEFPLYEYEAKLDTNGSDIDPACLPFEHLQSFQGQTIRRYYQDYRASLRGERATIIRRGEMQLVRGVSKRQEIKEKGLNAWDLPEPWAEMSRFKKFFTVRNPETDRVYSVVIDRCVANGVLCQGEVEYNGVLNKTSPGTEPTPLENSQAEAAVIADILLLRDALIERYNFQPTTLSKKKWLRRQMD